MSIWYVARKVLKELDAWKGHQSASPASINKRLGRLRALNQSNDTHDFNVSRFIYLSFYKTGLHNEI